MVADTTQRWIEQDSDSVAHLAEGGWLWRTGIMSLQTLMVALPRHGAAWAPQPNPQAGIREAAWLCQNESGVANEEQPWIAVLGNAIVARGSSFEAVYQQLREQNIRDALVSRVRPRNGQRPYRIA